MKKLHNKVNFLDKLLFVLDRTEDYDGKKDHRTEVEGIDYEKSYIQGIDNINKNNQNGRHLYPGEYTRQCRHINSFKFNNIILFSYLYLEFL